MGLPSAFFVPDGDVLAATPATQGPWSTEQQHGGPVSAVLTRALEQAAPAGGHLARVAVDLLRPVPVAPVRTTVRVLRPGRSIALLQAELSAAGADEPAPRTAGPGADAPAADPAVLARATAWWRRQAPDAGPDVPLAPLPSRPAQDLPTAVANTDLTRFLDRGYIAATEYRYAAGGFEQPGPTTAWWRSRLPLVEGERTSPTQSALLAADVASGLSAVLDFRTHLFTNVDLVVNLLRPPRGEWLLLHCSTAVDPAGGGLTTTTLADATGTFGQATATLFVRAHGAT